MTDAAGESIEKLWYFKARLKTEVITSLCITWNDSALLQVFPFPCDIHD